MNGRVAKEARKRVYGDFSIRARKYKKFRTGQVISDDRRRSYQAIKDAYGIK